MPDGKNGEPVLATFSGIAFYPLNPKPEQINIEDIAHGLSHTCRYAAQSPIFYSVAEHSVLVSQLLESRFPEDKNLHKWGLLHDAPEAYLGDKPRPLKAIDFSYQELETSLMSVISVMFKLDPMHIPEEVKQADSDVFLKEKSVLWDPRDVPWWETELPPVDTGLTIIRGWNLAKAKRAFLTRFGELFDE